MFFKREREICWEMEQKRSRENMERFYNMCDRLKTDVSHKDLARLYFELQKGKWDEGVFGNKADYVSIYLADISKSMMKFIEYHIGTKALERYQYVDLQGHTLDEFEDYWQSLAANKNMFM